MGSVQTCWCCRGRGWVPAGFGSDVDEERCPVVACQDGQIAFPLTPAAVRDDMDCGLLTDGYLCTSDMTEGRCDHCDDLAMVLNGYLRGVTRETAQGWVIPAAQCDHYSCECRCG